MVKPLRSTASPHTSEPFPSGVPDSPATPCVTRALPASKTAKTERFSLPDIQEVLVRQYSRMFSLIVDRRSGCCEPRQAHQRRLWPIPDLRRMLPRLAVGLIAIGPKMSGCEGISKYCKLNCALIFLVSSRSEERRVGKEGV